MRAQKPRNEVEREQRDRAREQHDERGDRDAVPVQPIGDVSGVQRDADERQRFGQPHEAERQRIVRDVVDLPGDDDALDLRRDGHRQQRDDEPAVVLDAECGVWVVGHGDQM